MSAQDVRLGPGDQLRPSMLGPPVLSAPKGMHRRRALMWGQWIAGLGRTHRREVEGKRSQMSRVHGQGENTSRARGVTRLSVNISADTADALRELAERNGTSVTNVVRRAVGVYKFLDDQLDSDHHLQIVDKSKNEITTIALV